ncbi:hypothetical protein PsorP6_017088 [Peronosclerospora sorghi]|uniref:Uncharacterized protein n=1 Tax=Peronosclerospora sorghi TaxID=230839 RepID=A0ACC0WF75_9STRA|nr:hypothetical protein PsorP6_017088 [Peronosclerospora sorghi]
MSLPQHSVPAVSEYAPKSSVPGLAESTRPARTDSSIDSSTSGVSAAISTFHASATSTNAAGTTSTGREGSRTTRVGDVADAAVGATPDWREKDADRSARQQIARIMCVP